jgi:membrane protein DedA with SNARE-associated domain
MLENWIFSWISSHAYLGIFSLLMLGIVGLPVPDETLLVFTGYLVYKGDLHFLPAVTAAFLGSIYGITLSYGLGRTGGVTILKKYGYLIRLTDKRVQEVDDWFERRGKWALVLGYFVPGFRHLTALAAGASKLRYFTFAPFAYSGAFVWSTLFIVVGYLSGKEWTKVPEVVQRWILAILGLGLLLLFLYYAVRRMADRRR